MKELRKAICPSCKQRALLPGERRKFNPKTDAGKQVCIDCKVAEIYEKVRKL